MRLDHGLQDRKSLFLTTPIPLPSLSNGLRTHTSCADTKETKDTNEAHRQSHHRTRFQAAAYFLLRERMRRKIRSKPIGKAALCDSSHARRMGHSARHGRMRQIRHQRADGLQGMPCPHLVDGQPGQTTGAAGAPLLWQLVNASMCAPPSCGTYARTGVHFAGTNIRGLSTSQKW